MLDQTSQQPHLAALAPVWFLRWHRSWRCVLQAGGGDAQGGVVLPGSKGRVRVISSIICPGGTCLLVYSTSSVSDRTSSNVK